MQAVRRALNILLWLLPLGFLAVGAFRMAGAVWNYLRGDRILAQIVSREASRTTERQIVVREVHLPDGFWRPGQTHRIRVTGLRIAEDSSNSAIPLLTAEQVELEYSLWSLLSPPDPQAAFFSTVTATSPVLNIKRNAQGLWNFERLFKPTKAPSRSFTDRFVFANGTLFLEDRRFSRPKGVPERPLRTFFTGISGYANLRPQEGAFFDLTGRAAPQLADTVRVTGLSLDKPQRLALRVQANRLRLPFVGDQLIPPKTARITSGAANLDLWLNQQSEKAFLWHGDLQVANLAGNGEILGGSLRAVNGALTASSDAARGQLTGEWEGIPVRLQGEVAGFGTRRPGKSSPFVTLNVQGNSENLDIARVLRAVAKQPGLKGSADFQALAKRLGGRASVQFELTGTNENPAALATARLEALRYGLHRAENINLRLLYANRVGHLEGQGTFDGGQLALRGQLETTGRRAFRLEARARNLPLRPFGPYLDEPLSGIGQFDLVAEGARGKLVRAEGQAQVNNLRLQEMSLQAVYARAGLQQERVQVYALRAEDDKGKALVHGTADLKSRALNLYVDADELDIGRLIALAGPLANRVGATSAPLPPSATDLSSPLETFFPENESNTLLYRERRRPGPLFASARKPVSSEEQPNEILPDLGLPQTWIAPPSPAPGETDLLASLEGIGYVRGRIRGGFDAPVLEARVSAFGLEAGKIGLDQIAATVRASKNGVAITQGLARRQLGIAHFSGQIAAPFTSLSPLKAELQVENLDIYDLLTVAGVDTDQIALAGSLSTDPIVIGGTLGQPEIETPFTARLEEASLNGQPLRNVTLTAELDNSTLYLTRATAEMETARLALSGWLNFSGQFNLKGSLRGLSLETAEFIAPVELPVLVEGELSLDLAASGSLQAPRANLLAAITNLKLDGTRLGDLRGAARYADRRVELSEVTLDVPKVEGENVRIVRLTYDLDSRQLQGTAELNTLPIQAIREIVQASIDESGHGKQAGAILNAITGPIEGTLTSAIQIAGTSDRPQVNVIWSATDIRVEEYEIAAFTGKAIVDRERLRLPEARIEAESGALVVEAQEVEAVYDGEIRGEIGAYNVDLTVLQNWILHLAPEKRKSAAIRQLHGVADNITVVASGKTASPELQISVALRNVAYAAPEQTDYQEQMIDRFELYDAAVREGSISGSIRLLKKDRREENPQDLDLRAFGSVAFTWEAPFIPEDAALNLQVGTPTRPQLILPLPALYELAKVIQLNLTSTAPAASGAAAPPPALFPDPLSVTDGVLTVSAKVGGTRNAPQVSGAVNVTASRMKILGLSVGLQNVHGTVALEGDRLMIGPDFQARTLLFVQGQPVEGYPGTPITLAGSLPLGLGEQANPQTTGGIRLAARNVEFNERPLPGVGSGYARGVAGASLNLTGTLFKPKLSGEITLENTSAGLPAGTAAVTTQKRVFPIDPEFDVQLRLLQNVRLSNTQLSARLDGDVALTGTLSDPRVNGLLRMREGTFALPTARFTILPPGAIRLLYPSYEGPGSETPSLLVNVDLRAQSFITARSYNGELRNYRVVATVRGPLSDTAIDPVTGQPLLTLNFQTDPPDLALNPQMVNQRLTGILGGMDSTANGGGTGQLAQQLTGTLTGSLLSGFLAKPASQLGFEDLSFGYTSFQQLSLNVSRRLFGNLYASYFRILAGGQDEFTFKASLRLLRERAQISWSINQENEQTVALEGILRF